MGWLAQGSHPNPLVVLVWKAIHWPTAIFFVALSCSLIYRYVLLERAPSLSYWFTPGAAFGGFIWLAASFAFRIYLHFFNNYSVPYVGRWGALMILLVWLYATGLALLIGAVINAEIERSSRSDQGP